MRALKNKTVIILLLLSLLILCCFSATALADDSLNINAPTCILLEAQSGEVLYEKNSADQRYPASVTKMMTLVLALESVARGDTSLDDVVTASAEAASLGGSQVYLFEGEQRSLHEMLIAVAVGSGNDASFAVAEYIGGSAKDFVDLMNQKAAELGMKGTHFVNPHGLHDADHYTTAKDLAILARHAVSVPKLLEYTSIYEYDFRPQPKPLKLWNTNRLLKWYDGADGLKTGYTDEAGRNLAATAQRDGLRLISVVMGAAEKNGHYTESMKLLNYGFNLYSRQELYAQGTVITKIIVEKGAADSVELVLPQPISVLQKKGEKPEVTLHFTAYPRITAPCEAGEEAGKVSVMKDGDEIASYPLVTAEAIAKGSFWRVVKKVAAATGIYF